MCVQFALDSHAEMYKLKTEVQNNHGINFRLVGIMQVGGQKKLIGRLSGFASRGPLGC